MGDSHGAQIVVRVPQDDPGHGRPMAVFAGVVWEVVDAGILAIVEAVGKLQVVHIDAVVVDSDRDTLSRQPVILPDIHYVNHLEHPLASFVQGILCGGVIGNARIRGIPQEEAYVIVIWVGTGGDLVDAVVQVRIHAGSISGTVVAALGIYAAVAVGVECPACNRNGME